MGSLHSVRPGLLQLSVLPGHHPSVTWAVQGPAVTAATPFQYAQVDSFSLDRGRRRGGPSLTARWEIWKH